MKIIETRNSTYEVDEEKKLVRRTAGKSDPCNYIGEDGTWRPYLEMRHLGETILFVGTGHHNGFITSAVVSTTDE